MDSSARASTCTSTHIRRTVEARTRFRTAGIEACAFPKAGSILDDGAQREPLGHRRELAAAAEPARPEPSLEEAPVDRDEGRSAGQEDAVDVARGDAGSRE